MSQEQPSSEWSRPVVAAEKIFEAANRASHYLSHHRQAVSPEVLSVDHDEEFRQFAGRILLANDRRYHGTELQGLHAVSEEASHRPRHTIYPNATLLFGIMTLAGTDSRGNKIVGDGLNVYGNPNNPAEITHSFTRLLYGDRFLPISMSTFNANELRRVHDRLASIPEQLRRRPWLRLMRLK